ncbi:MAG: hypothetical protein V7605_1398 [Acidimicrobiaceae bacterium]
MTTLLPTAPGRRHPAGDRPQPEDAPPTSPLARLWAARLWAHAAALAVVLLALIPVLGGTGASFSADEGAALVQARHLARGQGWVVDHPLPQVDPGQKAYPLELSSRGDKGTAPFVKHPLYALLLAGADRIGGTTAMVLLSLAGTVTAAALAAALAIRLRPTLARPSLWVVGLATPLLFDGYLVIAHTLGAAFAAGAALLALRAAEGRGPRWLAAAGAAGCLAVAVLLRNEAVFWALGLGVVTAALAISRRSRVLAVLAFGAVAVAVAAHVGEQAWIGGILGGHVVALGGGVETGLGLAKIHAFVLTWLRPGYGDAPRAELALSVMSGVLVVGALAVRRHPGDRRAISLLGGVAAVSALVALLVAPANLVPGLLVACPVLAAGLCLLRRSTIETLAARFALGTCAAFAVMVAATQYSTGGSGEWGGRYFALGLPLVIPVVLLALADAGARLDRPTRQVAAGALAVCAAATAVMGVTSLGETHRFTARLMATADRAGRTVSPGGRPVMLATTGAIPRLAWATFDRQRWLLSEPDDLGGLRGRLVDAGVTEVVLVSNDLQRDLDRMGPGVRVVSTDAPGNRHGWQVAVVEVEVQP